MFVTILSNPIIRIYILSQIIDNKKAMFVKIQSSFIKQIVLLMINLQAKKLFLLLLVQVLFFILTKETTPVIDCAVLSGGYCQSCSSGFTLIADTAYYQYQTTLFCLNNNYMPQNCLSTTQTPPIYVYNDDPNMYTINLTSGSTINLNIINTTPGATTDVDVQFFYNGITQTQRLGCGCQSTSSQQLYTKTVSQTGLYYFYIQLYSGIMTNYSLTVKVNGTTVTSTNGLVPSDTQTYHYFSCVSCNTGYFYLNSNNLTCVQCNATLNYFGNPSTKFCQACTLQHCITCSSLTACTLCDTSSNYFLNQSTNICQACTLQHCITCLSLTTCTLCDVSLNYFVNQTSNICSACTLQHCITCSSLTTCTLCDASSNYFVNQSTNICQACTLQHCITCSSLLSCTLCNASQNYFINQNTQTCRFCDYLQGCTSCSSNITCETCNQTLGYFINVDTSLCVSCSFGCINCDSRSNYKCTQCLSQFTLSNGICSCHFGSYLNKISLKCQACSGICQSCVGPSDYQCKSCYGNQNRIQIKQSNGLVSCICNPYNYVQADNGSNVCVKKSQTACDFGYIFMKSKNKCMQICGDGLVLTQNQCDDGNLVNEDGCSDQCLIQSDFTCSNQLRKPSTCIFIGIINIIRAQAYKNPFGNFITIYCQLSPIKSFFYEIDWKSGLKLIGPKLLVEDSWMEKQSLVINMSYYEDLSGKTLTIKYSSQNNNASSRLLFSSAFQLDFTLRDYTLPIRPANNLSPVYYSDSVYEQSQMASSISVILSIVCICAISAAFLLKTSFSMFQIIISLQLVLLSLGTITEMHPIMLSITQFSPIRGIKSKTVYFEGLVSPNQVLEYNIQTLGYVTSFFGNMNIMIFIQISVILATGALYLMSKKDLSFKTATKFARRNLMLVVIFSSMNLILSLGIFTSFYPFEVIVALCTSGVLIAQIVHFIRYFRKYYFFDTIFDAHNSKVKKYLIALFVCKLICALFISVLRKHTLASSIIVFIVQIVFSVIFSVIRPFINKWMNILVLCAEWIATLFVLFNMLVNLDIFGSSELQTTVSLIQISLCYVIVFLLCISLIYTIYIDYCLKSKITPIIKLYEGLSNEHQKEKQKKSKQDEGFNNEHNVVNIQDLNQSYHEPLAASQETINLDIFSPTKKRRTHK